MLLEREGQLGALEELVARLGTAGGKVVLIRGEAGVGKSALVKEFAKSHVDDLHVVYGGCDDLLIPQPLGPFWDMARVEASLREPVGDGDRPRVLDAVLELLSRSLRPTIVIIEDTQWADEATLDSIKYLGRRIAETNGLLILTYRDGEVDYDHPLRGVIGDIPAQNVARIHLGGLSVMAVSLIVGDSNLDPHQVLEATDGNAFLVTEMASAPGDAVPSSLQDSVMARVRHLSADARELLKTLAVIPEPIPRLDALRLAGADEAQLDECERGGLLDTDGELVAFRHDLTRRAVEGTLSTSERLVRNRIVLDSLPEETHPGLLIHCAVEANDIDRLVELAPKSARYAAATGSHVQAVEDFRTIAPHLDRFDGEALGRLLDEWAHEEFLVDNVTEAIELNESARALYRELGDRSAESKALAQGAHFYENAGKRDRAEELASQAVDVLGTDPNGADLARALEANAYLQWMAGNFVAVPPLVDQTIEVGGEQIDERILIRSLTHLGVAATIANYPEGRASLDEARERAEAAGQWYEEGRALVNHAWAAAEARDLPVASDYAQRAIASAVRHELPMLEGYSRAMYARVLDLKCEWSEAEDLARDLVDAAAITQMVALPIVGVIEARSGRTTARPALTTAWEMASIAAEDQRLTPTAIALAEYAWISNDADLPISEFGKVMTASLEKGFTYSPGALAFWLWKLGELSKAPQGIAEPYRIMIEGKADEAAAIWRTKGIPYEEALALMHGDQASQREALELFETMGATAVAGKHRQAMRARGMTVPRGKSRDTRRHAAGLTARQTEVLILLNEGLSNTEIADRLFVSPRTVEHHVSAILTKLDATTRHEAVARARDNDLLPSAR